MEQSAIASRTVPNTCARSSTTSAPLAAGPASGFGQPSRGLTSRMSVRPKLSIARAALPMFCPSCGRTSTMAGGLAPITDRAGDLGEIAGLAEVLVDAGETDVGDVIEGLQTIHHRFADFAGLDLVAASLELPLNR